MGTSNSYGGPASSTPLVPTWLDSTGSPSGLPQPATGPDQPDNKDVNLKPRPTQSTDAISEPMGADRYRKARTNFTRFAKSGGNQRSALGRAISSYVSHSSGGSGRAAAKMGSSKRAAVGLINFLNSARSEGLRETLQKYNLGNLIGKSIEDIFLGLVDFICPDGGSVDEGIARSAFIDTIADVVGSGITDLNSLSLDQLGIVVESYATNTIETRLYNDIGTKIVILPENLALVERAQGQLHDFISRGVSDAMVELKIDFVNLTASDTASIVDKIYIEAFTMLQTLGELESQSE